MGRPEIDNLHFRQLSQTECGSLTKPFSTVEVKVAVWDFWEDLQGNVMCFISKLHWNCKLAKGIDSTFIALIPKIESPQRLNDFRPISLVGNHYKILENVLGNRLRLVIGSVVSESQTTFMRDMQTLDEVFIANEAVDEARRSKKEFMFFKVDFEKAYDSSDLGYLDDVIWNMSFPVMWRKSIRECVCMANKSILVNDIPTEEFPLERGLR
jgi:hypothetical protein